LPVLASRPAGETAANEKHSHNRPKIIAALYNTSIITEIEACGLFCASPSPDGQKKKSLCVLGDSVVK